MLNILKLVRGDASKHTPREVKSAIRLPAGRCGEPQMSMHVRHAIKATIIQPCCRERNQAAEITVWSGSRCNPELEDTKVPLREVVSFVRAMPLLSIVSGGNSTSSPIPASCHPCAPLHLSIGASVPNSDCTCGKSHRSSPNYIDLALIDSTLTGHLGRHSRWATAQDIASSS